MIKLLCILAVLFTVACSSATSGKADQPRKKVSSSKAKKSKVVMRDGKPYVMLEEHERLCSDCDR